MNAVEPARLTRDGNLHSYGFLTFTQRLLSTPFESTKVSL